MPHSIAEIADAIGAQVTLETATGAQTREVQLGGGFMSFDASELYFGLGSAGEATGASIRWSDGTISTLAGPLNARTRYRIQRR